VQDIGGGFSSLSVYSSRRVCVFHFFLLCTLRFDFELGQFLLWLISSAAVALLCSRRSLWGVPLDRFPATRGVSLSCGRVGWVCSLFLPATCLVFVSNLVSSSFSLCVGCRIGSDLVLGVRRGVVWRSVCPSSEAGQYSVRSNGSLVLSLGHGFGGFRLNCLSLVWYHQNQIAQS
jgi:hypothetical protein